MATFGLNFTDGSSPISRNFFGEVLSVFAGVALEVNGNVFVGKMLKFKAKLGSRPCFRRC